MPAGFVQPAKKERHFGLLGKTVAGLTALFVVLCLIGAGGYLASRQLYFLGTNGQGTVVVYRGFPYVLPFGIPMYETYYVSGVPAVDDSRQTARHLLNHAMRDQTSAIQLVNDMELGQDQQMRARNWELFGLIPAALLLSAGFAAVYIQRRTSSRRSRSSTARCSWGCAWRRTSSSASRCPTPTPSSSRWWRCSPASGS